MDSAYFYIPFLTVIICTFNGELTSVHALYAYTELVSDSVICLSHPSLNCRAMLGTSELCLVVRRCLRGRGTISA